MTVLYISEVSGFVKEMIIRKCNVVIIILISFNPQINIWVSFKNSKDCKVILQLARSSIYKKVSLFFLHKKNYHSKNRIVILTMDWLRCVMWEYY